MKCLNCGDSFEGSRVVDCDTPGAVPVVPPEHKAGDWILCTGCGTVFIVQAKGIREPIRAEWNRLKPAVSIGLLLASETIKAAR